MQAHGISVQGTRAGQLENQDVFWCDAENRLFVVSDGVGSIDAGQMAAFLFTWGVVQQFAAGKRHPRAVADGFHWAQGKMMEYVRQHKLTKMGACGSVAWLDARGGDTYVLHVVHIGDTRVKVIEGDQVRTLTSVHRGYTAAPERRRFLDRYVGSRTEEDYGDYSTELAPAGSWLFLMSDGMADVLDDVDLTNAIRDFGGRGPYEVANRLIMMSQVFRATDDLTVVAVYLD